MFHPFDVNFHEDTSAWHTFAPEIDADDGKLRNNSRANWVGTYFKGNCHNPDNAMFNCGSFAPSLEACQLSCTLDNGCKSYYYLPPDPSKSQMSSAACYRFNTAFDQPTPLFYRDAGRGTTGPALFRSKFDTSSSQDDGMTHLNASGMEYNYFFSYLPSEDCNAMAAKISNVKDVNYNNTTRMCKIQLNEPVVAFVSDLKGCLDNTTKISSQSFEYNYESQQCKTFPTRFGIKPAYRVEDDATTTVTANVDSPDVFAPVALPPPAVPQLSVNLNTYFATKGITSFFTIMPPTFGMTIIGDTLQFVNSDPNYVPEPRNVVIRCDNSGGSVTNVFRMGIDNKFTVDKASPS